jgi:hypothetical protein
MRTVSTGLLAAAAVALASAALAQHAGHGQHNQPYADLTARTIKSLSGDQLADLQDGRGMGLSLPAELNGYPGPKHVLELGDQLGLSAGQRQSTTRLIDAMSAEAIAIGKDIITLEAKLESLFADRTANQEQVRDIVDRVGAAQASLRYVHLKYHLAMRGEMTAEQVLHYATLRGYSSRQQ